MAAATDPHIAEDARRTPVIEGPRIQDVMIARERRDGLDAEANRRLHPDPTPGRIRSAIAYYEDHQASMDKEIARRDRLAGEKAAAAGDSPSRKAPRGRGLIP